MFKSNYYYYYYYFTIIIIANSREINQGRYLKTNTS